MNIIISIEGVTLPEVSAHVSRCFVSLDWGLGCDCSLHFTLFLVEFLNFDIDTVMDTQYLENVSADPRELGRGHEYLRSLLF